MKIETTFQCLGSSETRAKGVERRTKNTGHYLALKAAAISGLKAKTSGPSGALILVIASHATGVMRSDRGSRKSGKDSLTQLVTP